jgi:hypothetical protein
MESETEQWAVAPCYHAYMVSTFGRVMRVAGGPGAVAHRILKPGASKGHLQVGLYDENGRHYVFVHRLVASAFIPNTNNLPQVDHIDMDKTNNHVSNLRFCTNQMNQYNKRSHAGSSSVYKGVYFNKQKNKWQVTIMLDGKNKHLGLFDDEQEAARKYDEYARVHHGEFARLNFPDPQ